MPPHHTGTRASRHTSWTRRADVRPPTRPALMLTIRVAPSSIALRATTQDALARAAEQLRQRAAAALRDEVPDRHLEGRLRHAVLADPGDDALGVLGLMQLGRHQRGDDDLVQQVPNGLGCLARVPG